jgi:hypothetical protein
VGERCLGRFRRNILRNVYHNFPPCENIFDIIHDGPHHSKKEIIPPGGGEQSSTARETLASPSIIFNFWEIKVALACRPKRLLKSYQNPSCRLSSPPHYLSEGLDIAIAVVFVVPTVAAVVVAAVALAAVVAVVVTAVAFATVAAVFVTADAFATVAAVFVTAVAFATVAAVIVTAVAVVTVAVVIFVAVTVAILLKFR